jgi:peptide/nickel transport system substrate-binding protein
MLTMRDVKTGDYIPMLADKWESSADAKTWTFYLHKGVQFHGGWGEFTAVDVKFSYEQGMAKGTLNSTMVTWNKALDSMEIVNPYQIVFHFPP